MPKGLWAAILLVAVVALASGVGMRKRQAAWQRTVDSLTVTLDSTRAQYSIEKRRADSVTHAVRQAGHKVAEASEDLRGRLDTARAVLGDSTASQTRLRLTLAATITSAERLRAEVLTYQEKIDTLVTAHLSERQAAERQMQTLQAVVDVQARALEEGRCSSFVGQCPTRWQAFGIGVVVAIVVSVLL